LYGGPGETNRVLPPAAAALPEGSPSSSKTAGFTGSTTTTTRCTIGRPQRKRFRRDAMCSLRT
jgi:hypothetical protein